MTPGLGGILGVQSCMSIDFVTNSYGESRDSSCEKS